MPSHALQGGFSPSPGEEESSSEEGPKPEEKLETNEKDKITSPQKSSISKRIRRGGKKNKVHHMNNKVNSHIKVFATNGAGVKNGKINSLNAEVRSTRANIVMIQETHCTQKGKIHMDNHFVIFEAIRKKKRRRHTYGNT